MMSSVETCFTDAEVGCTCPASSKLELSKLLVTFENTFPKLPKLEVRTQSA